VLTDPFAVSEDRKSGLPPFFYVPAPTRGLERRYRGKDRNWKSSGSFSRNEIPLAIYCVEKAFEYMIEGQQQEDDSGGSEKEPMMY
jgi:hypothetical protein